MKKIKSKRGSIKSKNSIKNNPIVKDNSIVFQVDFKARLHSQDMLSSVQSHLRPSMILSNTKGNRLRKEEISQPPTYHQVKNIKSR